MYVWHIASSKWGNNNKERGKGFFVVVYLKAHRLQTCDYLGGSNIQFVAIVGSKIGQSCKLSQLVWLFFFQPSNARPLCRLLTAAWLPTVTTWSATPCSTCATRASSSSASPSSGARRPDSGHTHLPSVSSMLKLKFVHFLRQF